MRIYIGTPTASTIHAHTVSSLIALNNLLVAAGHDLVIDTSISNTIHFIRNTMAYRAVETQCDFLVFIDSDVSFDAKDVANLIFSDRDVTALAYRKKRQSEEYCCLIESDEDGYPIVDSEGWIELFAAATGILCIKREVLLKMMEAYSHRSYTTDNNEKRVAIFEYELHEGKYWGEDYTFSRRWKKMGGKIWLYPNATTAHHGISEYTGNIHYFLHKPTIKSEYCGNTIQGWTNPSELEWLYRQAKRMESVVEIGCWKGRSTHAILTGCPGTVYAVDHFKGTEADGHRLSVQGDSLLFEFKANVGSFANLKIMPMPGADAAIQIECADMVFIDGDHSYESVLADIKTWLPKTKKLICGHDYTDNFVGVRAAVDEIFGAHVKLHESIWYVEAK